MPSKAKPKDAVAKPKLLSGGNPQIPKADGDAPVQAYIAAMPGWKRDIGRRLGARIVRNVPDVRKAVRWNSPFYGVKDQGWFLSYHCLWSPSTPSPCWSFTGCSEAFFSIAQWSRYRAGYLRSRFPS
jgi:hypothetical protein